MRRDRPPPKPPLKPTEVGGDEWKLRVRVPGQNVVIFTRQLATMLQSGVQIVQALQTLSHQVEYPNFGEVIRLLAERIETGHKFSHALTQYPRLFPRIFATMVQIGEETGQLDGSLERLAGWMERDENTRQRIKSALTYPAFVLTLAFGLTLAIFYTVLPAFVQIFTEMHIQLPIITRIVIQITNAIRNPGVWLITIAVVGVVVKAFQKAVSTKAGAAHLYSFALKVPIVGGMLKHGGMARYAGAVEALLSCGMDMPRALRLSAAASGSPIIAMDADNLVDCIMNGEPASVHMANHPEIYVPSLTHMVAAGEEASRLPEMFGRAGGYHDLEMNYQVDALSAALEPLMLCGVALVVGTIVLSIFLPMYSYLSKLG